MLPFQQNGDLFSVTASGTARTVATKAAVTGKVHYLTDLSVSGDAGGLSVSVINGSGTIWQDLIAIPWSNATATLPYHMTFATPLKGTSGEALSVVVGTAGTVSKASFCGFTI